MAFNFGVFIFVLLSFTAITCHCQAEIKLEDIAKKHHKHANFQVKKEHVSNLVKMNEAISNPSLKETYDWLKSKAATNDSICISDLTTVVEGLMTGQFWALQMFDAFGKLPPGVLQGNIKWTGDYKECLNFSYIPPTKDSRGFRGRYCSTTLYQKYIPQLNPTIGVCLPEACSGAEVDGFLNYLLGLAKVSNVTAYGGYCQPLPEEVSLSGPAIAMVAIMSVICTLLAAGTLYDLLVHDRLARPKDELLEVNGPVVESSEQVDVAHYTPILAAQQQARAAQPTEPVLAGLLLAFSVRRNLAKLLYVAPPSENNLATVHGVRFLSMSWVILGHSLGFLTQFAANPVFSGELFKRWTFQAISSALVSVDSFFLLSGTLTAYLLLKELDRVGGPTRMRWRWLVFYVHRFWRLTPPYMLLIGLWTTVFQYTGSGPNWAPNNMMAGHCNETWWTNLLYVNNIVEQDRACMGWSWYLANDMQFFVISPLFIVPLYYKWWAGVITVMVVMLASMIATGLISVHYKIGMDILSMALNKDWFNKLYQVPWTRIGPYLVGILLGYVLYKTKLKCRMHWVLALLGWAVAAACALAIIYGPYNIVQGHEPSLQLSAFFNSVHRTVWGACLAWVIFACTLGYGGPVNKILSWSALVPLSRLTYMAYLVHLMVIYNYYMASPQPAWVDDRFMIWVYLGNLVVSYGVALVVSLALEAPMLGVEKVLLKRK